MDQQTLQAIRDAATVIQALLDERLAMQQELARAQQPQAPPPQSAPVQKTASESPQSGFSRPAKKDFVKNAHSSDDDARGKFAAFESEVLAIING